MPENNISIDEICDILNKNEHILVLIHDHPDGDALGSAFALKYALEGDGRHKVKIRCTDTPSERYAFLCNEDDISADIDEAFDLIVSVDMAELHMLGKFEIAFSDIIDLKIDHHMTSKSYAKYNYVDGSAAACAEIIYEILKKMNLINADCAKCLYSGIATDTGCFKFRNATAKTHLIVSELFSYGIDVGGLNHLLFENKSKSEIMAQKIALNSLKFYNDGYIAVVVFTKELKDKYDISDDDISPLHGLTREIQGVELGITIRQKDDDLSQYKVSMRSGEKVDASYLCSLFGGGGHIRAAGCEITADSPEMAEKIILEKVLEKI